jgi:hypothetical protein
MQSRYCDHKYDRQNKINNIHYITIYEDGLKSSWTHFITPSRHFVEVRCRSLF